MSKQQRKSFGLRTRYAVFAAGGFRCHYCGRRAGEAVTLQIDHVVPLSAGGTHDRNNLVAACWECNQGKAALQDFPKITWIPIRPPSDGSGGGHGRCANENHPGPFVESFATWSPSMQTVLYLACLTCNYAIASRMPTGSDA